MYLSEIESKEFRIQSDLLSLLLDTQPYKHFEMYTADVLDKMM